jgi:hypothetical protein
MGCRCGYVGTTTGVAQIADDLRRSPSRQPWAKSGHKRQSNPDQYSVNVVCPSGLSPFDFENVVVYDGVNHPEDTIPESRGLLDI